MEKKANVHQLPFDFAHRPYMGREDFIKAPCNAEALEMVELWPRWPAFALCIYGPEHCGKTHLAHIFAKNAAVQTNYPYPIPQIEAQNADMDIPPLLFARHPCLIVENLCENIDEEAMFHLFNLYRNQNGFVLFTAEQPPARMRFKLPDLQSRLNMIPAIGISEPDDELLSALIVKLFMDRQITISREVINYILVNMQRSFTYAHRLVEEIDAVSLSYHRAVSIPIVKEAINSLRQCRQGELF